ncbi:cysteine--tRNA ligase [candidate division GN15 bacterium]|uniref:Cysteine--tRNA ligase n=1 Tax=candidate division GN15 bacterium TaxID=2072418 RepID=A0A855WYL9_9BACT|nr:MAG: cysteine--tRNA ligase [candidate division GN15 bacterium]
MALRFKNSLSRRVEEFVPIEPGVAKMYTCGPTVYNFAHIGNFRAYIFEDLLRRYLSYKGYRVTQVMNLTDIDDKIIRDSKARGIPIKQFTAPVIKAFFEDIDALRIERAEHYPPATEHIPEMVALVKVLLERGHAYQIDGDYYYRIASFPKYGQLANLDMQGLKAGARVDADEYEKESVSDFALWKAWDENDGDAFWETELGKGRPGWHLECSAMSTKYLGKRFDIHTGGVDNMFPHHENEIAQSEGATGETFVNYWLHCEHLMVDGRKMSKSLGNQYTLRDVLDKGYSGLAVRYLLMATHYRQQLNFTFEGLESARAALERYNDFISNLESYPGGKSDGSAGGVISGAAAGFEETLDDDLNISGALGVVFDFIRDINRLKAEDKLSAGERDEALKLIRRFDSVLDFRTKAVSLEAEIEDLIRQRTEARKSRNFAQADKIRDDLLARGIILEDTPQGVKWKRKV